MSGRGQARRDRVLQAFMLAYCAASLLHFVHNAVFLHDYPNMPMWLSAGRVYAAWCGVTAVGVAGYALHRAGCRVTGLMTIAVYAAFGFSGLDHYALAPVSAHSFTMNLTIRFEALAAAALLIAVCVNTGRWTRGEKPPSIHFTAPV